MFLINKKILNKKLLKKLRKKNIIITLKKPFKELQKQEINNFIIKGIFKLVLYNLKIINNI